MTENEGTDTPAEGTQPDPNTVSVDKAEFERLQISDKFFTETKERADDMDLESPDEYLETLESVVQAQEAARSTEKTVEPKKEPVEKAPVAAEDPRVAQAHNSSVQAILTSHYAAYQVHQFGIPEDERVGFEKKQLDKLIHSKPTLVTEAAKDFDGNLYDGAAHILSFKQTKVAVKQETEAALAAKAKAAGQADIPPGGKTAEPEVQTAQQKQQAEHKSRQDSIYPDG